MRFGSMVRSRIIRWKADRVVGCSQMAMAPFPGSQRRQDSFIVPPYPLILLFFVVRVYRRFVTQDDDLFFRTSWSQWPDQQKVAGNLLLSEDVPEEHTPAAH